MTESRGERGHFIFYCHYTGYEPLRARRSQTLDLKDEERDDATRLD